MITIGGDGTLLRSITYVRDLEIPIMGINSGRLGFLATMSQKKLNSELIKVLEGNYKLEESKKFTIAPAYNKGAYQVITKSNIKDIGR